jgi:Lon protease-like protein
MTDLQDLPLFPLQTVLFPGGLLSLKVFEARYLDLMGRCLRESGGFGVVALRQGQEVRRANQSQVRFERCGVLAELVDVDSPQPGILQVRCRGTERFTLEAFHEQDDGLWVGRATPIEADPPRLPPETMVSSVRGLEQAMATLARQGSSPFLEPLRFDDAGWVANRWCELLPISLGAKQKLMELDDPLLRLQLVDEFLRDQGVVG